MSCSSTCSSDLRKFRMTWQHQSYSPTYNHGPVSSPSYYLHSLNSLPTQQKVLLPLLCVSTPSCQPSKGLLQ